jgi:hypothetical protein
MTAMWTVAERFATPHRSTRAATDTLPGGMTGMAG